MKESDLVKKIMSGLEKGVGGYWYKVSAGPFQISGLPDIVGCCNGRFFGLEVKLPGKEKTLTPIQKHTLNQMKIKGGAVAEMVTSVDQAIAIVKDGCNK